MAPKTSFSQPIQHDDVEKKKLSVLDVEKKKLLSKTSFSQPINHDDVEEKKSLVTTSFSQPMTPDDVDKNEVVGHNGYTFVFLMDSFPCAEKEDARGRAAGAAALYHSPWRGPSV